MEKTLLLGICASLLVLAGCASSSSAPETVREAPQGGPAATNTQGPAMPLTQQAQPSFRDIPYVPEGSLAQRLDIYLPRDGDGPFPGILALHGGGFHARDKAEYQRLAGAFTDMGYAFVPANYRLTPKYSYPAQVEDIFCALAWIRSNHEDYDLDGRRIIVMGESAGGYLAAMLATVDDPDDYLQDCPHDLPAADWIQGAIIFYGFYDFASIDGYPEAGVDLEPYWGTAHADLTPEKLAEMSPQSWVDGRECPFLLVHGTSDAAVPSWMSEEFATVLEEAGVEVELLLLEADHAFLLRPLSAPENVQSLRAVEAFLSVLPAQ
jgi:acetyl esterase/lipase